MNDRLPASPPVGQRLAGRMVAVSISVADDQARMGYTADYMDRVLQAILLPAVTEGATIAYGGRIEHEHNYTLVLSSQLGEAYRRMEQRPGRRPFVHFVALHRFQATAPAQLLTHLRTLAPYGEIWVTGRDGVLASFAAATPEQSALSACQGPGFGADAALDIVQGLDGLLACPTYAAVMAQAAPDPSESFTQMRRQMAALCHARVLVGGRSTGFSGPISGLCEEALATLAAQRPLFVLGGFGGASRDIAIALGLLDANAAVPALASPDRERYEAGLAMLRAARPSWQAMFPDAAVAERLRTLARTESLADASRILGGLVIGLLA